MEQFSGHEDGVTCLEFDSDHVYSAGFDQNVLVWDVDEMKIRIKERGIMTKEDIESRKIETFYRALNSQKKGKSSKKNKKIQKK